jgi:hypothetical protein
VCKRPCECFKSKNSAISSIAKKDERRKLVSGGDCQGRNCAKTKNAKKIVAQNRKTKKKKKAKKRENRPKSASQNRKQRNAVDHLSW